MAQKISPWLEGAYGWSFGESGWNAGMDENLLKFSFMFDGNVDSIVASLPPVSNDAAHFNTTDNRFYFGVGTVWYSSPCPKSFIFKIKSNGDFYQFNGTSAVKIDNPSEIDSRLDAVELTLSSLGTAAFQNVEDFATQVELDVVEGQSQGYTDALRNDLADSTDPAKGAGLVGYRSRRLDAVISDIAVSVKDYGAKGDGVTDDTTAILAALSAVKNTGKSLYMPAGIYMTAPIDLREYRNLTIKGEDEYAEFQYVASTVIRINAAGTTGIKIADDDKEIPELFGAGVVIKNLHIDANNLVTTGINMCRAVRLENVRVTGAIADGIVFEGQTYPVFLKNVVSQGNGRHGLLVKAPFTTVFTIEDSEFGFNGGNGVTVLDGSTAVLKNVLCQSNVGNGFSIIMQEPGGFSLPIFLERLTFINCYAEANGAWGIFVDSYNVNPASFIGKLVDFTFINCSFNSDHGQRAYLRGMSNTTAIGTPWISAALSADFNTVGIDVFPVLGVSQPRGGVDLSSGAGKIKFPATVTPSSDPRTLDDYHEGTFSPSVGGTSAAGTATYSENTGTYTKVGDTVFFILNVSWSAHTGAGSIYVDINDLPYNVGASAPANIMFSGLNPGAGKQVAATTDVGAKRIRILSSDSAGGALGLIPLPASGIVYVSGFFKAQ